MKYHGHTDTRVRVFAKTDGNALKYYLKNINKIKGKATTIIIVFFSLLKPFYDKSDVHVL